MERILFSIVWKDRTKPTIETVAKRLKINKDEIDPDFGIVEIDPDEQTYSIRINKSAAEKITGYDGDIKGPFSDPKIQPMDLQEE